MNEFKSHTNCASIYISPLHSRRAFPDNFSFFLIFTGAELLYNVVLVSTEPQSESAIRIYTCALVSGFASPLGHHGALSRVPRALQRFSLVVHFIHGINSARHLVPPSRPTLHDPVDCSPAGFSVHGIFQAKILEWVAISSSRDLLNPEVEPESPVSPALKGGFSTCWAIGEALLIVYTCQSQYCLKKTERCAKPGLLQSAL